MLYPSWQVIAAFFVAHWSISVFFQSFFLHRYCSHRMFSMSPFWEKFFRICTVITQGASYLSPRAYAILHREHHAYSDTERDPHSPVVYKTPLKMMAHTWSRYAGLLHGTIEPEARFVGGYPEWPAVDRVMSGWAVPVAFGTLYTLFYFAFAPHWAFYLLLPVHFLMGPIHGLIVNWAGHKYGYRNFPDSNDDSRNTLPFDFITMGELFQNNHHKYGMAPKFAARWFEVDPTYLVMKVFHWIGIIDLGTSPQRARYVKPRATPALEAKTSLVPPLSVSGDAAE